MKKVVRLSENDLTRLVRKIISEAVIAETSADVVTYLGIKPGDKGNITFKYDPTVNNAVYLTNTTNNASCWLKAPSVQPTPSSGTTAQPQ
jgi:hypothetical protein